MIQLDYLSELAKLSTHKSRNLLSDVKDYRNKICTTKNIREYGFYTRTTGQWKPVFSQIYNTYIYKGRKQNIRTLIYNLDHALIINSF